VGKARKILTQNDVSSVEKLMGEDPKAACERLGYALRGRMALHKARRYTFDGITASTKRKTPPSTVRSLDAEFTGSKSRDKMVSTARDLFSNFGFARGLLKTHVKNVVGTGPHLQLRSGDEKWDETAEKYFRAWSKKCDVRGQLTFTGFIGVGEARQLVDGDCGLALVKGGRLQGIEGDRIANPPKDKQKKNYRYEAGVEMTREGWPIGYYVHKRKEYGGVYNAAVRIDAQDFRHLYLPDRFDQVRGVTWLMAGLNDMRDLQEVLEAVKIKTKVENVLGVAVKSDAANMDLASLWGTPTDYTATAPDGSSETRYEVMLGQGVHSFELAPGESVDVIESKTPNNTFDAFTLLLIRIVSLTINMPLEIALQYFTRGSYSGHRAAFLQYYDYCIQRRQEIEDRWLNSIVPWVIEGAMKRGDLPRPTLEKADTRNFVWQWPGLHLLDPDKERRADLAAYKMRVMSLSDICARDGRDWQEVGRQIIREVKWYQEEAMRQGIDPRLVMPQTTQPGENPGGATAAREEEDVEDEG